MDSFRVHWTYFVDFTEQALGSGLMSDLYRRLPAFGLFAVAVSTVSAEGEALADPGTDDRDGAVDAGGSNAAATDADEADGPERHAGAKKRLHLFDAAFSDISDITTADADNTLGWATGVSNQVQNKLNLELQLPINFATHWSVVVNPTLPISSQPALNGKPAASGLGDLTLKLQLSPTHTHLFDWGAGVEFQFPTATNSAVLGKGKYAVGPKLTATLRPHRWFFETTISNLFSFAGSPSRSPINQMKLEQKLAYDFSGDWTGWFAGFDLTYEANWDSPASQVWQVPVGGGGGRFFKVWSQSFESHMQIFYNVMDGNPATTAQWNWEWKLKWFAPKHY
jgi:hypothetical protein